MPTLFLISSSILTILAEDVYDIQLTYYLGVAIPSVVVGCVLRLLLANGNGTTASGCAYTFAVFECGSVLLYAIAAVVCQCEQLGMHYAYDEDPNVYDQYHGIWHILLALTIVVSSARFDTMAVEIHRKEEVQILEIGSHDFMGMLLFDVYAILAVATKETALQFETSQIVLRTTSVALAIYVLHVLYHL
jgi:hypothetical protein